MRRIDFELSSFSGISNIYFTKTCPYDLLLFFLFRGMDIIFFWLCNVLVSTNKYVCFNGQLAV